MTDPALSPESSVLSPGELEIRLTVEQAEAIIYDVLALRRATSVAPDQTPMLDRLVNTLVLEVKTMTGVLIKTELKQEVRR